MDAVHRPGARRRTHVGGDRGTRRQGAALLLVYSLGLGVPFVAGGLGVGPAAGAFGWVKRHYRAINLVSGALLAGFGVLLFTNRLTLVVAASSSTLMDRLGLDWLTDLAEQLDVGGEQAGEVLEEDEQHDEEHRGRRER